MVLTDPYRRAVNPYTLALQTGISRNRRPRLSGFLDDLEASASDIASQELSNLQHQITTSGSNADIVPYQNAVFNQVIVPISNVVNSSQASTLSTQQLEAMLNTLISEKERWLQFANTYPWPTSTARNRAIAGVQTLAPYWDTYEQRIRALIPNSTYDYSGVITGVTNPAGTTSPTYPGQSPLPGQGGFIGPVQPTAAGFSTPWAVGLGLLAFYLFSKKRGF